MYGCGEPPYMRDVVCWNCTSDIHSQKQMTSVIAYNAEMDLGIFNVDSDDKQM